MRTIAGTVPPTTAASGRGTETYANYGIFFGIMTHSQIQEKFAVAPFENSLFGRGAVLIKSGVRAHKEPQAY